MIGTHSTLQLLVGKSGELYSLGNNFKKEEYPDYMQVRESLLIFEKLISQKEFKLHDQDHDFMANIHTIVERGFGTQDLEWFSAAEAYLNTIFGLRIKNAPSQAKDFI